MNGLRNRPLPNGRQAGALTLFTALLVLVLLSLMLIYATRVSVSEQRISANDMRQKLAFHAAEAGIQHGTEYLFANNTLIVSSSEDVFTDGSDGWLAPGVGRWRKCTDYASDYDDETDSAEIAHPCRGESSDSRRINSYFYYYDDPAIEGEDPYALPLNTDNLLGPGQQVSVRAALCVLVVDFNPSTNGGVPVSGCTTDSGIEGTHFMVTLLAHGESDCNAGNCLAEAFVSEPVSNFSAMNGPPPNVPLTTRSNFEGLGTVEVVPNPNAGGVGVPVSVWASNNNSCSTYVTSLTAGGNWKTCEGHEYYGQREAPGDLRCPSNNCSCEAGEAISYTAGSEDVLGIDMFWDAGFPCDLFQYFFGVPRSQFGIIKNASIVLQDCSSLGPDSAGLYWITGECNPPAQTTQIGSIDHPVVIVAAGAETILNSQLEVYGILYVTDAEPAVDVAQLSGNGTITFYGAMVVDGAIKNFNGTLSLLFNRLVVSRAHGIGNLAALIGGWTDFPKCWHAEGAGCP
jgi:hypothetical protein